MINPLSRIIQSLCLYFSIVYQILSSILYLQLYLEAPSVNMLLMNTWNGSYACDIDLLTANIAAAL